MPRVTAVHAAAVMDPRHDVLALVDGALAVTSSAAFLAGGRGRIMLTRGDLLDHGLTLTPDGQRFAPGNGPALRRILDEINSVR
jgi:hypothetical protein